MKANYPNLQINYIKYKNKHEIQNKSKILIKITKINI